MAAQFTRIEVLFDKGSKKQKVIVKPDPAVQAIFFDGSEKTLLKDFATTPKRELQDGLPSGIEFDPGTDNGPAGVCYLVGGTLHCWNRSA